MRPLLTTGLLLLSAIPAHGQCGRQARRMFSGQARQACAAPQARFQATTQVQTYSTSTTQVYSSGQVGGFGAWLNSIRSAYGRGPVAFDATLAGEAALNNGQQRARGLGHHWMGSGRRQNVGFGSYTSVTQGWMQSPAHAAALLDPSITVYGIASDGTHWTYSAR